MSIERLFRGHGNLIYMYSGEVFPSGREGCSEPDVAWRFGAAGLCGYSFTQRMSLWMIVCKSEENVSFSQTSTSEIRHQCTKHGSI